MELRNFSSNFPVISPQHNHRRQTFHSAALPPISSSTSNPNSFKEKKEIRVCVNRTCSKQGSREIFSVLADIAPPEISVASCGCLGLCGAGPNLVLLPTEVLVRHCGTANRAAEVLARVCGKEFDPERNLEALSLRKRGEVELVEKRDFHQAQILLSQAIGLNPSGGLHIIYTSRSVARLGMGDMVGALEDAKEASLLLPMFPKAYICEGDVYMATGNYAAAKEAYSTALKCDPTIRRSKSFKVRIAKFDAAVSSTQSTE